MAEGLCWCASDIRCPHGISQRLPPMWEEMEKIVDDILQQFDRKSIKRYLKKDLDGTNKSSFSNKFKDAYKMSDDVKAMMEKTKPKPISFGADGMSKKRKVDQNEQMLFSKTVSTSAMLAREPDEGMERPRSATVDMPLPAPMNRSPMTAPKHNPSTGFTRDLMSSSLPKLPPRTLLPSLTHTPGAASTTAASRSMDVADFSSLKGSSPVLQDGSDPTPSAAEGLPKTNPMNPLQAESVISVGLMRIADRVARKVLPWQAVLCPRAVESLQELRMSFVQTKHATFMSSMKAKLEEKVSSFLQKKEAEVDEWVTKEVADWQAFLAADETDLSDFLQTDLQRITQRAIQQDIAYRQRELQMANDLDDHERDQTREMLNNFRRIVRATKSPVVGTSASPAGGAGKRPPPGAAAAFNLSALPAGEENNSVQVEVRILQDNIARAQNITAKKFKDMVRTNIRKQEECHDWLCSLADNAMTASINEEKLHSLYGQLDFERQKSLDSLHSAMMTYQEQHNAILEAIVVFAGRIHQHASDYLQREQLVNRAFTSYLLGIISGEIKSNTQEQKKNSYAWETKSVLDRGQRKDQMLMQDFHHHINPLDRMVQDFKDKMKIQLEHITMKLQAVINGKENDVNARKALIHKKLAKHVNKACNARRQRLKDATAVRRDEFELEALAVAKVDDLTGDLRAAIDSVWVKEHLRERRIFEASLGRLERLEKTALIIWNKHAHLAVEVKEDYEDWLETYKKDRDERVSRRKEVFERDYFDWRTGFGKEFQGLSRQLRQSFTFLIPSCYVYDVEASLDKNLEDVQERFELHRAEMMSTFQTVRAHLEDFLAHEMQGMDVFTQEMRTGLLQEWRENLVRLDGAINRRIGGLKDMEADLEETIRLTILQHEVEANVFEQQSCARLEGFWIDWTQRMNLLARDLLQSNEDYEIAKMGGKARARASQKDRQLDDMVHVAKDSGALTAAGKRSAQQHTAGGAASPSPAAAAAAGGGGGGGEDEEEAAGSAHSDPIGAFQSKDLLLDAKRLRVLLEDIKPDVYRDFSHKLTRGLERVRRDLGEGRQRLVPPFAALKTLLKCSHRFYEQAKLSERCIGRISSRGVLLFSEGLPLHAQATFSIATSLAMMAQLQMRENKIDCDDLFSLAESVKVYFLIGLLTVTHAQFNDYGRYMLQTEMVWMCSVLEILPPVDLLQAMDCKGLREQLPRDLVWTGIFSDDPVDLLNSMVDLPTDLHTVQRLTREYEAALQQELRQHRQQQQQQQRGEGEGEDGQGMSTEHPLPTLLSEDPAGQPTYNKAAQQQILTVLDHRLPAAFVLSKLQPLLPAHDILILLALLGRPDTSIELSTHRVCQAVSLWRKVSFCMVLSTLTAPSSEFPRLSELINKHHVANMGSKRMGPGNINCMSSFQTISINIDYLTSIHGVPLSILQAMALISKSGNVDIWLEDPKQSRRHERLIAEIRDMVDLYHYHIPKSMKHNEYLQMVLPKSIFETLKSFDLNKSNVIPLELIRTFVGKDDLDLNNNQLSMIFWSLCRINEDNDDPTLPGTAMGGGGGGAAHGVSHAASVEGGSHPAHTAGLVDAATSLTSPAAGHKSSRPSAVDVHASQSVVTVQTSATHRFRIQTPFHGNTNAYIHAFFNDLNNYLHSMPYIDSNVIIGFLPSALIPAAAYELVSDAMKLDLAAHNPMPTSAILYVGQRVLPIPEILQNLLLKRPQSKAHNYLLGVTEHAFCCSFPNHSLAVAVRKDPDAFFEGEDGEGDGDGPSLRGAGGSQAWETGSVDTCQVQPYQQQMSNLINKLRVFVEVDILTKYRELVEIKASDRHYGPAGNDPMAHVSSEGKSGNVHAPHTQKENFYWQELLYRRLNRLHQLLLNWRDVMLDEWANSLYSSRTVRYQKRIQLVIKSISVYHKQYDNLRDVLFQQRSNLINLYNTLLAELNTQIQSITSLCLYHVNFLQRCLRRFEGEYDRIQTILQQCMYDYTHHISSIKRRAINRVNLAFVKLKNDLENSCNGLILGYTSGYAQLYFNNLMTNTDRWKSKLLDLQGNLIVHKEKFMYSKEHIDRDLTLQMMDKLTSNRMEYKEFLQEYTILSNQALAELNNIHSAYILYQKDGNNRLILKIEKAVRECRKIRSAAEQEPLLETEALRDMRTILTNTKLYCLQIVTEIQENCSKQLQSFLPMRSRHRQNLETKRDLFTEKWRNLKSILCVLIEDYHKEMQKVLGSLHVQALHSIHMYLHEEQKQLQTTYRSERALLIGAFRKHFRDYDLCEAAIFERFNTEVNNIVEEMILLYGPARPPFIVNTLTEMQSIIVDSLDASVEDILSHQFFHGQMNDSFTLQRMELTEVFNFNLTKVYKVLQGLTTRFLEEKQEQIAFIEDMSMTKNGDMVRPQVKAVLDLLISGIEIDNDFHKGYHDLIAATQTKSDDCISELSAFVTRYNTPEQPLSIPYTITLFHQRVNEREYEVNTLLEASQNHMIADHSKLEVIYNNYQNDINEWAVLTNQLIENAFHNAEKTYLSHLWPSPTNSPRENTVRETRLEGEEDKYISKYKEILDNINNRVNSAASIHSVGGNIAHTSALLLSSPSAVSAGGGMAGSSAKSQALVPFGGSEAGPSTSLVEYPPSLSDSLALPHEQSLVEYSGVSTPHRPPAGRTLGSPSRQEQVAYKGDMKVLMDNLTLSEQEEEEHRQKKLRRRQEKEAARLAAEEEARKKARKKGVQLPKGKGLPELKTIELQQGWFQCTAPEGYTYFHHPDTGESLWELPLALRRPLREEMTDSVIETPRELIMSAAGALYVPETVPIRVVDSQYKVEVKKDPETILAEVAEEARAISALVVDTAVDITRVLRGKYFYKYYNKANNRKVNKEESIAMLLGDRYNPDKLQKFLKHQDEDSDEEDERKLRKVRTEDPNAVNRYDSASRGGREEDGDAVSVDAQGRVIGDGHSEVDSELKDMLLELGIGASTASRMASAVDEIEHTNTTLDIVQPTNWLSLGLGTDDAPLPASDSDGEDIAEVPTVLDKQLAHYNETKERDLMRLADEESTAYENAVENSLCNALLQDLTALFQSRKAYEADKLRLQARVPLIKPGNVISIFHDLHITWQDIDTLILNTQVEEENERKLAAELNKANNIKRQERIIEHAEDIEDLANFLHANNLSKITSKRIAITLVLNNILTPKKLAKLWSRKEFDLDELNLDADDREELEAALSRLLSSASASAMDLSHFNSLSYVSPAAPRVPVAAVATTAAASTSNLDALLGEIPLVETEGLDDPVAHDRSQLNLSQNLSRPSPMLSRSTKDFVMTRDGYKSFTGGWVEGLSDQNEVYYYNVRTGQSAWHLPDLLEQDEGSQGGGGGGGGGMEDGTGQEGYPSTDYAYDGGYTTEEDPNAQSMAFYDGSQRIPVPASSYDLTSAAHSPATYYDPNASYYPAEAYPASYDANGHEEWAASAQTAQDYVYDSATGQYYPNTPAVDDGNNNNYYDYYDPNAYPTSEGYYDPAGYAPPSSQSAEQAYLTDGSWHMAEALGVSSYQPKSKPRAIPTYSVPEAQRYAKEQGVSRQVTLLTTQDNWQHALVHTQHTSTSQKSLFLSKRQEIFQKLSGRVESKLESFVNDIKAMQKLVKKELGEANATERDLRRLFEEDMHAVQNRSLSSSNLGLRAEKLSFILESLEKFKASVSEKYDSAFKQIEKFSGDWEMIRAELMQVGDIFDEGIAANLEQCRLACEHAVKVFVYDQLKQVAHIKNQELSLLRKMFHKQMRSDRLEEQQAREKRRKIQYEQWLTYETAKYKLLTEYNGSSGYDDSDVFDTRYKSITFIEEELAQSGYKKLTAEEDVLTEEELVMSMMITQLEMEESLGNDYDSVLTATQTMSQEMLKDIAEFDAKEKQGLAEDGSWFNKHREAMERHEQALHITLEKVRTRVQEGYSLLQSRIEALDYEVERAAEEELNQHSLDQASFYGSRG